MGLFQKTHQLLCSLQTLVTQTGLNSVLTQGIDHLQTLFGDKHSSLIYCVKPRSHIPPIYCHICICDVAASTAWATSWMNKNMCHWQLEPSQSFTAGMPSKLNSSQLCKHAAVKTGMTNVAGHFCSHIRTVSQAVLAAMYSYCPM